MLAPEEHGASIRRGLRRAAANGVSLGGIRPAREAENLKSHDQAVTKALMYREVLEQGEGKSLSALGQDLFAAGCRTSSGKRLTPEMVRRMRVRLQEAKQTPVEECLDAGFLGWDPPDALRKAIRGRNRDEFLWYLKMVRKELGDSTAERLMQRFLLSKHASWVRVALADR